MVSTTRSKAGKKEPAKAQASATPSKPAPPASPKAKNKVVATKTPRSPDLKHPVLAPRPEGSRDDSSVASGGYSSAGSLSTSGSRPGVALFIQKELAEDIEALGGIAHFKKQTGKDRSQLLSKLCDKNPEVYGRRGDILRKQIRNRYQRWVKLYDSGTYTDKVLNRFEIKSYANRKKPSESGRAAKKSAGKKPAAKKPKQDQDSPSSRSDISSSDGSSSSASSAASSKAPSPTTSKSAAAPAVQQAAKKKAPPKPKVPQEAPPLVVFAKTAPPPPKQAATSPPVRLEAATMPRSPDRPEKTTYTDVNIHRPDDNREVMIFSLTDIPGVKHKNSYHHGYFIHIPSFDPRFYNEDYKVEWYRARVFSNNQVLLSIPSFSYTLSECRTDIVDAQHKPMPSYILNGIDNGVHDYKENKDRKFKHIMLNFPEGHVLSGSEISDDAGDDENLDVQIFPIMYDPLVPGADKVNGQIMGFVVARLDIKANKRGRVEEEHKKASKGAALLGMLYPNTKPDQPMSGGS